MATIEVTKNDFEAAIPVAATKNSEVFDMLSSYIENAAVFVENNILGSVGMNALSGETNGQLARLVKGEICFRAFLPNFRSLDVVLTSTGFGVVSTQDTAPASKMRTDALKSQLDIEAQRNYCNLLSELFKVSGWGNQSIRQQLVQTLFWHFDFLAQYAGKESPIINDWRLAQPYIMEADGFIRKHIGDALADELLEHLTANSLTAAEIKVVTIIQQLIGLHICGNKSAEKIYFHRLMNTLEGDIDTYPKYKDSEAYQYNHFKGYENTKDSGMFIFQG